MPQNEVSVQAWEGDEYVVCMNGEVVGQTLHRRDAEVIKRWLETTDLPLVKGRYERLLDEIKAYIETLRLRSKERT